MSHVPQPARNHRGHRHAAAIHGYITRRLGRDAADDLVAETFLVAFRPRGRDDPDQPSARYEPPVHRPADRHDQ